MAVTHQLDGAAHKAVTQRGTMQGKGIGRCSLVKQQDREVVCECVGIEVGVSHCVDDAKLPSSETAVDGAEPHRRIGAGRQVEGQRTVRRRNDGAWGDQ